MECEVRVLTYKRPKLLHRALMSLVGQSHQEWKAYVFDDSPAAESALVISEIGDRRIIYRGNPRNLGMAANTDQAFQAKPFGRADYAFILEDDNWLYANFITANIDALEKTGLDIMMRNQEIWIQDGDATSRKPRGETTTRGEWMSEGVLDVVALRAHLFFHEGVSHGALFWRLNAGVNLEVGSPITNTWLAERVRTTRVSRPLLFCSTPAAAFTLFKGEKEDLRTSALQREEYHCGAQVLLRHLICLHGRRIVGEAAKLAHCWERRYQFEQSLVRALYPFWRFRTLSLGAFVGFWAIAVRLRCRTGRHLARAIEESDPLGKKVRIWSSMCMKS